MGMLDNTYTKTLSGKTWLNSLKVKKKILVKYFSAITKFKFGDRVWVIKTRKDKFPSY